MSHFSVLVITPEKPDQSYLSRVLQPWHEFECTGIDDQYVVDVDKTEEMKKDYETDTTTRLKDSEGKLHSYFDEYGEWNPQFSKIDPEASVWEPNRRVRHVPEGFEEVEVPYSQVMSFRDYVAYQTSEDKEIIPGQTPGESHKFGRTVIDKDGNVEKVIDRTNPQAKWGWWVVGGRYKAKLIPFYDPYEDPENKQKCIICNGTGMRNDVIGKAEREKNPEFTCNGCNGTKVETKWNSNFRDIPGGDQQQVSYIRWSALAASKVKDALKRFDEWNLKVGAQLLPESWESILKKHPEDIEAARNEFNSHPAVEALKGEWETPAIIEILRKGRSKYEEEVKLTSLTCPLTCFAMVHEGKWYQKGEMGWWGCVKDEKDSCEWDQEVNKLLQSLPPTHWITVVDCHI